MVEVNLYAEYIQNNNQLGLSNLKVEVFNDTQQDFNWVSVEISLTNWFLF